MNNNVQTQNNKSNEKFLEDFVNNPSRKIPNQSFINNNPKENIQKMNQNQVQPNTNINDNSLFILIFSSLSLTTSIMHKS